ncbi:hypothetical protein [Salinicoccus roseus]|uniref:hypothetical protein n=1 Tax=Salinicoccus roseus TaxID=45670 RepID=UPI0022FFFB01|nr:hypothetical protein [Salinicoccus roseus]
MRIQYITQGRKNFTADNIEMKTFDDCLPFKLYDLNILDFRAPSFWSFIKNNTSNSTSQIAFLNKHILMQSNLQNVMSKKALIFVILPQNIEIPFGERKGVDRWLKGKYESSLELRRMINEISAFFSAVFRIEVDMDYKSYEYDIQGENIKADFYIKNSETNYNVIKKANNRIIAFNYNNFIFTTLNVTKETQLSKILGDLNIISEPNSDVPSWFKEVKMFDDLDLVARIHQNKLTIKENLEENEKLNNKLKTNERYKSILYKSGEPLVQQVVDILEKLFEKKFGTFIDEKKEDFLFEHGDDKFIIEIKGVNSNVKSSNISQLDRHYLNYLEANDVSKEESQNIYKLLIINHQKNKKLNDRAEVHKNQIHDAEKKYEVLIVDAITLLKLLELKFNDEIDANKVAEMFKKVGILEIT